MEIVSISIQYKFFCISFDFYIFKQQFSSIIFVYDFLITEKDKNIKCLFCFLSKYTREYNNVSIIDVYIAFINERNGYVLRIIIVFLICLLFNRSKKR